MPDPFTDVDAASAEMIENIVAALETRAADPSMLPVIDACLDALEVPDGGLIVDVGAGAGGVTRRIADRFPPAQVLGVEPSVALSRRAQALAGDRADLDFRTGNGAALDLDAGCADVAILHTVLSHVTDPAPLVAEAARILRPGAMLVICDADFSKASLGLVPSDPLGACAQAFVAGAVTDAWLAGRLRALAAGAGLSVERFTVANRVVTGVRPCAWTVSGGVFDRLAGVMVLELAGAQISQR